MTTHTLPRLRVLAAVAASLSLMVGLVLSIPGCNLGKSGPRVIIVGIGGADWRVMRPLISQGRLPNIQHLIAEGAHGPLWSVTPPNAPLGWTSIATGQGPDQHGVLDFTTADPLTGKPTLTTSSMRRSKAFWNILSDLDLKVCAVGWQTSWPAESIHGVMVSDRFDPYAQRADDPRPSRLVYPPELTDELLSIARDSLGVSFKTASRFMQVTPEEYAAAPEGDYGDPISQFKSIYQTMTIRAAIAKHLARTQSPDVLAVCFEGVAIANHMYGRYAPPDYPLSTPEQREKFGHALDAFYEYQDELLGEMLELADANTNVMVISDHGFKTGTQRPVPSSTEANQARALTWHRLDGIILMSGPDIRAKRTEKDELAVYTQATIFDVTPTLLALVGAPVAQDLEGSVLTDMLVAGFAAPDSVPTFEDEVWRENRRRAVSHPADLDPQVIDRLLALGYLGIEDDDVRLALRNQHSLAKYLTFRQRLDDAEQVLMSLMEHAPQWGEPQFRLGIINMRRKAYAEARLNFEHALELDPSMTAARMNLAFVLRELEDRPAALAVLEEVSHRDPTNLGARVNMGMLHKETGHYDEARACFGGALAIDSTYHAALVQMAMMHEQLGDLRTAIVYWEKALSSRPEDTRSKTRLEASVRALRDSGE